MHCKTPRNTIISSAPTFIQVRITGTAMKRIISSVGFPENEQFWQLIKCNEN